MDHAVVAEVVRSGLVEGRHRGSVVRIDADGSVAWSVGDPDAVIYPRSCNKPIQAVAMVRGGLPLRGRLLALATASHSGESMHLTGVREILDDVGLDESALRTPPSWPLDEDVRVAYIAAGGRPDPICMDCSGKHAAMLATCVIAGWDTASYLAPDHPLQQLVASTFVELTGAEIAATGVDGCGAPLFATSLTGLARAFGTIAQAEEGSAGGVVAAAIRDWPEYVSGTTRDEARLLSAYPGAIAKSGAEACYALAMRDGTTLALKIEDGGDRARPVVMAEALRIAGYDVPGLESIGSQVLLGGGQPVGAVRAALG